MKKVKILLIKFRNPIRKEEIPLFRGATIHALKENNDILFHNHDGEQFRYSYSLIQYKRINQCAAIVCVDEGTEAIGKLFANCDFTFNLGGRELQIDIEKIKATQYLIQTWDTYFHYHLRKWLPLNQKNYSEFLQLEDLSEKTQFLEKILIGNILSFAKGVDIQLESQIACKITYLSEPVIIRHKEIKMMSFDADFMCNVSLPDYIGLGKSVSLGFGTVTQNYERK